MSLQFIYREDQEPIRKQDFEEWVVGLERASAVRVPSDFPKYLSEITYAGSDYDITIELGDNGTIVSFSRSSLFVEFGLEIQKRTELILRVADGGLNYDIDLSKHETYAEVMAVQCSDQPHEPYADGFNIFTKPHE